MVRLLMNCEAAMQAGWRALAIRPLAAYPVPVQVKQRNVQACNAI